MSDSSLNVQKLTEVVLSGASIALLLRVAGAGIRYGSEILFARWMQTEVYGAFAYALNWTELLAVVAAAGLGTTVLRFVPEYTIQQRWADLRGLTVASHLLPFAIGSVVVAVGAGVLTMSSLPYRWTILAGVAASVPLAIVNVQSSLFRGLKRMTLAYLGRQVLWPLLSIPAVYGALMFFGETSSLASVAAVCVVLWVVVGAYSGLILFQYPEPVRAASASYKALDTWAKVSLPLLLVAGFHVLLSRADVIMIGSILGAREAGLYNVAARTAGLISFILTAFNAIAAPLISEKWSSNDLGELRDVVAMVIQWSFWPSFGMAVCLVAFNDEVLGLFGQDYQASGLALSVLVGGQLINTLAGPVYLLLSLTGNERKVAWIFGISAVINIALNAVFVPLIGLTGGAVATVTTMIIWNVWLAYIVHREIGISLLRAWKQAFWYR